MTDTERNRVQAICEVAGVSEIDDLSDGFHTFRQLYYQRMMLFATIVKQNKGRAWKSLKHEDGELCFGGGWFIVGIDTPEGSYTYHYEDKYFSLFDCKELERGKHWDGHTEKDVTRLLSLPSAQPEQKWIPCSERLPEDVAIVTVETKTFKQKYVCEAVWIPRWSKEAEYDDWEVCSEYNEDEDEYYVLEGWYERVHNWDEYSYVGIEDDVIAWMPLPEPYKRGEEDGCM